MALAIVAAAIFAVGVFWWVRSRPVPKRNLLLITIDTLRADHVGSYGYEAAATPALDGLARRGVRFANAESAVPLTGPSHATILTGIYPPEHGVRDNVVFALEARYPSLATRLKQGGYRTAAFVAAYPVAGAFGFNQGFETFDESFPQSVGIGQGAERPGNEVADAAIGWLNDHRDGPFFVWAHFYDPHAPYAPPPPYDVRFAARPYDGEIAFADAQIGRVLEALRDAGHGDDTVIVAVADHGEGLGDHDEATHAVLIYESTLRVPMIAAGPGIPAGGVISTRVGTIDIVPTVLALLGLGVPPDISGRDLTPAFRGNRLTTAPLYAESLFGRLNCRWSSLRAWMRGDWKLIDGASPELYDVAADPGEADNRAAAEPERLRSMQEELGAAVRKMQPGGDAARINPISSEQEQRLRSLGYAAGSGGAGTIDEPGLPDPRTHVHQYDLVQAANLAQGPAIAPAMHELTRIAEDDPGNPLVQGTLASLAYRAGMLRIAAAAFARTIALDPDRPAVRQNYAKLLREMGHLAESERQFRLALAQSGDDERVQVGLAETLIARGEIDEANRLIAPVLARQPNHVEALEAQGHLLLAQHRAVEALDFLRRATATPAPEPWIELGEALLSTGAAQDAHRAASEALQLNPGHPWALAVLGRALIAEGRKAEGVARLRQALAAHPRRPAVWRSLAAGFHAAGDTAAAEQCRRQAQQASELAK